MIRKEIIEDDQSKNLEETKSYTKENKLKRRVLRRYDENGNTVESKTYNSEGELVSTIDNKYQGELLIESIVKNSDGSLHNIVRKEYNDREQLVSEYQINKKGEKYGSLYQFEYFGDNFEKRSFSYDRKQKSHLKVSTQDRLTHVIYYDIEGNVLKERYSESDQHGNLLKSITEEQGKKEIKVWHITYH